MLYVFLSRNQINIKNIINKTAEILLIKLLKISGLRQYAKSGTYAPLWIGKRQKESYKNGIRM